MIILNALMKSIYFSSNDVYQWQDNRRDEEDEDHTD